MIAHGPDVIEESPIYEIKVTRLRRVVLPSLFRMKRGGIANASGVIAFITKLSTQ